MIPAEARTIIREPLADAAELLSACTSEETRTLMRDLTRVCDKHRLTITLETHTKDRTRKFPTWQQLTLAAEYAYGDQYRFNTEVKYTVKWDGIMGKTKRSHAFRFMESLLTWLLFEGTRLQ